MFYFKGLWNLFKLLLNFVGSFALKYHSPPQYRTDWPGRGDLFGVNRRNQGRRKHQAARDKTLVETTQLLTTSRKPFHE
jgi:hypothetical protein